MTMERDKLAQLIFDTLKENSYATELQDVLVSALWPVFADIYDEGFKDGNKNEGFAVNRNPYKEKAES